MATARIKICMVLVTMVCMISTGVMAQSNCMNALLSMSSCLSYVTGSSNTPSSSCCSSLSGVLQSQPRCLCTIANGGGSSLGIQINQTLALALPGACNLQTPPVSRCNAGNGPAMSPMGSPVGSPEGSPEGAPEGSPNFDGTADSSTGPSLSGSKTTGSSKTSGGSPLKVPLQIVVAFSLFMVSFAFMT